MKKRSLQRLTLKKTCISNLEKTVISGGLGSLDSQVSCYNTCDINCHIHPEPDPIPLPLPEPKISVVYWLCPK